MSLLACSCPTHHHVAEGRLRFSLTMRTLFLQCHINLHGISISPYSTRASCGIPYLLMLVAFYTRPPIGLHGSTLTTLPLLGCVKPWTKYQCDMHIRLIHSSISMEIIHKYLLHMDLPKFPILTPNFQSICIDKDIFPPGNFDSVIKTIINGSSSCVCLNSLVIL